MVRESKNIVTSVFYIAGGCLYKGFNRATATLSAGALAIGVHWIAAKSGHKVEPVILGASVFLLGIKQNSNYMDI